MSAQAIDIVPPARPSDAVLTGMDDRSLMLAIEWRAFCLLNDVERLAERRSFYTAAEDNMAQAEKVLATALARVKEAQRCYRAKPMERSHAA